MRLVIEVNDVFGVTSVFVLNDVESTLEKMLYRGNRVSHTYIVQKD